MIRFRTFRGISQVAYRAIRALIRVLSLKKWFRFRIAEVLTASVSELKSCRTPSVFTVRQAQEQDVHALQSFYSKPQKVLERINRGDICIILLSRDKICAAEWLTLGTQEYREDWTDLRCVFRFPAGVGWLYDGKGHKSFRGAWGVLMGSLGRYLNQFGVSEVFSQTSYSNLLSINSHESLGYRVAGRICQLSLPGISICLYRNQNGRWRFLPGYCGRLEISGGANDVRCPSDR
jgi:hypothetical protein